MSKAILVGPFLTRPAAARRANLTVEMLIHRPDLLRVGGRIYKEAYFGFQFDQGGIRRDIGTVVLALRGRLEDATIADWLVHAHPSLTGNSPLSWMNQGGKVSSVLDVIEATSRHRIDGTVTLAAEPAETASTTKSADGTTRGTRRLGRERMPRPAGSH